MFPGSLSLSPHDDAANIQVSPQETHRDYLGFESGASLFHHFTFDLPDIGLSSTFLPYDVDGVPIRKDTGMPPIAWFRAQERTTVPVINDRFECHAAGIPAEAQQVDNHVGQFFKFSLVQTKRYYMSTDTDLP